MRPRAPSRNYVELDVSADEPETEFTLVMS